MTEQEKINNEMQMKLAVQDAKFNVFMEEMKDFKNEMRHMNESIDARVGRMETKIDSMTNHIQMLTITAMGGIIAAGVGIAAMVMTVMSR